VTNDGADGTVAWADLLREAAERFRRAGTDSPEVDARRIVEEASGAEPAEFHDTLARPATRRGVAAFDAMVARREAGEPLQYVVGRWGFRHLDLMVDPRVLIPRPETEEVAGLAVDEVRARPGEVIVADLGTGSGAIALALAFECPSARVLATDVCADALRVARANLAGLGRAARRVSLHEGSWFEALPDTARGEIDVLVSNPPYVADADVVPAVVDDWEPRRALRSGPAGLDALTAIVDGADDWVRPGGVAVVEMAPSQIEFIENRFGRLGWSTEVHVDLSGRERAVVARRLLGAS